MTGKRYTAAIVDDEPVCIRNLSESLADFPEIILVGEAVTAEDGVKLVLKEKPDLLFLDVELPGMNGLELLRELQHRIGWSMQVVFYTSHQKYWLDALRESAFDYLLKPYSPKEFSTVMRRFFEHAGRRASTGLLEKALSELLPSHQTFMVPDITGYQIVRVSQVVYFTYSNMKRQWCALLTNNKQMLLGRSTKSEHILSFSSSFVQINRHQIININYVCSIRGKTCNLIPPFEEVKDLCVSRNYLTDVQEKFQLL